MTRKTVEYYIYDMSKDVSGRPPMFLQQDFTFTELRGFAIKFKTLSSVKRFMKKYKRFAESGIAKRVIYHVDISGLKYFDEWSMIKKG